MLRLHRASVGLVLIALLSVQSSAIAAPIVLTFDDVAANPNPVAMSGYGGLSWAGNMGIWGGSQPPYNPQSSPNRVLFNLNFESGVAESLVSFNGGPKVFTRG